jgi:iron-sulfur cluster repair protein YtfE (RIC family)
VGESTGNRGLKRHPALLPLSRDHHFVLIHALGLRRAARAALAAGRGVVPTAEGFLAYYREEMVGHIADEEEALLPLASHVRPDDARRIEAEHEELRQHVAVLQQALAEGSDPRPEMGELGDLLHDHVRFEERVFFERIQDGLSAEQMASLGRSVEEHRHARGRGGAACMIAPRLFFTRS